MADVFRSLFEPGEPYKYIDLPLSNYGSASYDKFTKGDKTVGLSMFSGTTYNERSMLSLGMVDADIEIGEELILVWGEEHGGSRRPPWSATGRRRSAPWSVPCRIPRWCAKPTPEAGVPHKYRLLAMQLGIKPIEPIARA